MYLYKVTTVRNYTSYVLAENPDEAYKTFYAWMEKKNYGFFFDRYLRTVECIAEAGRMSDEYEMFLMAPQGKAE